MSISILEIPKGGIAQLRNLPRDIFFTDEGLTCAGAGGTQQVREQVDVAYGDYGLDIDIANAAGAPGNATITFDNIKVVTLVPGDRFQLENVLFVECRIQRAVAGNAINVNVYIAGISKELFDIIKGK